MDDDKLVRLLCERLRLPQPSLADSTCYSRVLAQDILNVWLIQKAGRSMALLSTNKRNRMCQIQLFTYFRQLILHLGLASDMYGKNLLVFRAQDIYEEEDNIGRQLGYFEPRRTGWETHRDNTHDQFLSFDESTTGLQIFGQMVSGDASLDDLTIYIRKTLKNLNKVLKPIFMLQQTVT